MTLRLVYEGQSGVLKGCAVLDESRLAVSRNTRIEPILTGQAFTPDIRMGSTPD